MPDRWADEIKRVTRVNGQRGTELMLVQGNAAGCISVVRASSVAKRDLGLIR